jgi:hypothetical protein
MPKIMRSDFILTFTISVSLFGSFTTLVLALNPPLAQENLLWRKPLIGSFFTLICVLGIIAAFSPMKCSGAFHLPKREKPAISEPGASESSRRSVTLKGHHLDCGRFSAHVISVDKHVFCAACTGLLLGALIVLVGTGFYFFGGLGVGWFGFSAVLIGQVGIVLGFVQFRFGGYVRLSLNAFFVLGAFLTLVGVDGVAGNVFLDLYLIVLIVFWLVTRILISQWDHWRICYTCGLACELKERERANIFGAARR